MKGDSVEGQVSLFVRRDVHPVAAFRNLFLMEDQFPALIHVDEIIPSGSNVVGMPYSAIYYTEIIVSLCYWHLTPLMEWFDILQELYYLPEPENADQTE